MIDEEPFDHVYCSALQRLFDLVIHRQTLLLMLWTLEFNQVAFSSQG
jgi:hypothetical protein